MSPPHIECHCNSLHLTSQHWWLSNQMRKVTETLNDPQSVCQSVLRLFKWGIITLFENLLLLLYYFHVAPGIYFHKPSCRWTKRWPVTCSFADFTASLPVNAGWVLMPTPTPPSPHSSECVPFAKSLPVCCFTAEVCLWVGVSPCLMEKGANYSGQLWSLVDQITVTLLSMAALF